MTFRAMQRDFQNKPVGKSSQLPTKNHKANQKQHMVNNYTLSSQEELPKQKTKDNGKQITVGHLQEFTNRQVAQSFNYNYPTGANDFKPSTNSDLLSSSVPHSQLPGDGRSKSSQFRGQ